MVSAHSLIGKSHLHKSLPNQDAIDRFIDPLSGCVIIAVADGHGSCSRSQYGSTYAIEAAIEELKRLLKQFSTSSLQPKEDGQENQYSASPISSLRFTEMSRHANESLGNAIVNRWRASVSQHIKDNPINIDTQSTATFSERVSEQRLEYGSTLLAAIVHADFSLFFQIGDGVIVRVASDLIDTDEVALVIEDLRAEVIFTGDDLQIANATHSLCEEDVLRHMQVRFQRHENSVSRVVLLTTDGYTNSMSSDDFLDDCRAYAIEYQKYTFEQMEAVIPQRLQVLTNEGSGDDITLGMVIDRKISPKRYTQQESDLLVGLSIDSSIDPRGGLSADPTDFGSNLSTTTLNRELSDSTSLDVDSLEPKLSTSPIAQKTDAVFAKLSESIDSASYDDEPSSGSTEHIDVAKKKVTANSKSILKHCSPWRGWWW